MKTIFSFLKLTFLLLFLAHLSSAQAQNGGMANYWYFGDHAGLSFNTGSAALISGPIETYEGVAVASDVAGNLLFSTDGMFVYNKNNLQMPNGFGLWGHFSATQSALIVPNPANSYQFYVFTVGPTAGSFGGVYGGVAYSIVDLSLNGGLGDVTTKNVQLVHPAPEKLTAAKHCNGTDYWVICHGWDSDTFYSYQITPFGINAPVLSKVGSFYQSPSGSNAETLGYIKVSPNGKKLAAAITYVPNNNIEIFDFDVATGILSNPTYIPTTGQAYGISFSPDNSKLYVGVLSGGLHQYDLTAANIPASLYMLNTQIDYGAVQLSPDGKLYGIPYNTNYLDVVNNPNVAGAACNYVQYAFNLVAPINGLGLPNFSAHILASMLYIGADQTFCGNTITLQANTNWDSYLWNTGDTTASITVNQAGTYWVQVTTDCGYFVRDTMIVYAQSAPVFLGNDTTLTCNPTPLLLSTNGSNSSTYLWSNGDTTANISVNTDGTYWVTVTDACGSSSDTIIVNPFISVVDYLQDTFVCKSEFLMLNAASGYTNYQWNTGANTQNLIVTQAGIYVVNMTDNNGCIITDSVNISLNPNNTPDADFTATTINNGNGTFTATFTYNSTATNLQSNWDFGNGTTDTTFSPPSNIYICGANYLVTHIISNECGADTFSFLVTDGCEISVENAFEIGFSVYPNPITEGSFSLKIEGNIENEMELTLYDIMGSAVFSQSFQTNEPILVFSLPTLPNGVYFVQLTDKKNNRKVNIKLIIMK